MHYLTASHQSSQTRKSFQTARDIYVCKKQNGADRPGFQTKIPVNGSFIWREG